MDQRANKQDLMVKRPNKQKTKWSTDQMVNRSNVLIVKRPNGQRPNGQKTKWTIELIDIRPNSKKI